MKKINSPVSWLFKDWRRILIVLIILGIGISLLVSSRKTTKPEYQTGVVEKGTLINSVSASGTVTTSNIQEVTTQASGFVKQMFVSDGDKVVKGQKIAVIELDLVGEQRNAASYSSYLNAVKGLNAANNNVRSAKTSRDLVYDQIQGHATNESFQMIDMRTKAEVAYDNANDGLKTAQASLTSAQFSYNQTSPIITAPSSGVIKLSVVEGSQISAGSSADASNQRIATISTNGLPLISVSVSEIDVPKIQNDQKVTVTFDSLENLTFTGKVVAVDKLGNTSSGVTGYTTLIRLDSNNEKIFPKMAATAVIITDIKTDVLLVPSAAVQTAGDISTVRIMKDGVATTVPVETGGSNDTQTIITSGLSVGDTVITGTSTPAKTMTPGNSVFSTRGFGGGMSTGATMVRINR